VSDSLAANFCTYQACGGAAQIFYELKEILSKNSCQTNVSRPTRMRHAATYIVLTFAVCLSALRLTSLAAEPTETVITLERTTCYGTCPSYTVAILKDGTVNYFGREYVRVKGAAQWKVDPAMIDSLVKEFIKIDYFSLDDGYTGIKKPDGTFSQVTGDLPTTITSLSLSGKHKEIVDNLEARAPTKLRDLEHAIDDAVNSKKWVSIDAETVHQKCNQGWDINGREAQALLLDAMSTGDADVVRAFIEEGADVKKPILSPILCFARGKEIFELLIAAGADPNGQPIENLYAPLLNAANLREPDSIAVLLKAGARVDAASADGTTALMVAARSGVPASVKLLLAAGANPAKKNELGWTAMDFARSGEESDARIEKYLGPFGEPPPDFRANFEEIRKLLAPTQNSKGPDACCRTIADQPFHMSNRTSIADQPFHMSAFDDPGFAKLSCYFSLPPTFFTHMVAQKLPN
jgi:Domain of unknown function (DUF6438)/Ankyrin repeats (3 copies)